MDTMNGDTITVSIPTDRLKQLKAFAARFHVTPEELVRISVEELLSRPGRGDSRSAVSLDE